MATAGLSIGTGTPNQAPMPPAKFPLGHLGALKKDPFALFLRCRAAFGDVVRLKLYHINAYLLSHPDHVHHVLQKKQPLYDKDLELLKRLKPILGEGMVTADGAAWKHQRDVARPAFHNREIQSFGPVITGVAGDTIERWRSVAAEQGVLDMHQEMMHVTLRIASKALFGVRPRGRGRGEQRASQRNHGGRTEAHERAGRRPDVPTHTEQPRSQGGAALAGTDDRQDHPGQRPGKRRSARAAAR